MSPNADVKEGRLDTSPTGPGYVLMLVLVAMLIGSINYANNMAYILCFLLTGLMLVAFLHTRNNLKGLEIINVLTHPVFAGEPLQFTFELHNRTRGRRIAIYAVIFDRFSPQTADDFSGPYIIDPLSRTTCKVAIATSKRGRFSLPRITLYSLYPLGLFQVKYHLPLDKVYIVYPKPFGSLPWPDLESHEDENSEGFYNRGGDDFVGVKPYRIGESQRHIDWKAVARGRPMSVKEFTGGGSSQQWFDWDQLGNMQTEERISQLTRWVVEADPVGKEFGLRIPGTEIKLDSSPGHTVKCLEALALFQHPK